MATIYIALEIGIGCGAFFTGFLYANQIENFPLSYNIGGFCALLALFYISAFMANSRVRQVANG